jgi:hypothetical protein
VENPRGLWVADDGLGHRMPGAFPQMCQNVSESTEGHQHMFPQTCTGRGQLEATIHLSALFPTLGL